MSDLPGAVAGICPNDGSAVTFHLDPISRESGRGKNTDLPGDVYFGRCDSCQQVLTKVAGPVHTTVGGGPSPLEDLRIAMAGRRRPEDDTDEDTEAKAEEAQRHHDEAAARREEQANAEAAEQERLEAERRNG